MQLPAGPVEIRGVETTPKSQPHEKVVVVTRGGAGIGLATVYKFLEEGARVVAVDRTVRITTPW